VSPGLTEQRKYQRQKREQDFHVAFIVSPPTPHSLNVGSTSRCPV